MPTAKAVYPNGSRTTGHEVKWGATRMVAPHGRRCQFSSAEQSLCTLDALAQAGLEMVALADGSDVARDSGPDDIRNRLILDTGNSLELLGLFGREANRHCFLSRHTSIMTPESAIGKPPW